MKAFLGIIALVFFALQSSATAQEQSSVVWMSDLQEATKVAQDTGMPMFIVFR